MYELCRRVASWDEPVPKDEQLQRKTWVNEFERLHDVRVPRCVKTSQNFTACRCQLHHFSDASARAYVAKSCAQLPPGVLSKEDCNGRRRSARIQYAAYPFWRRRRRDHLSTIPPRQKWTACRKQFEGDMVLQPRNRWFSQPRNRWLLDISGVLPDSH